MTMWYYRARIDRVVDGDTIDVEIDLGFHVHTRQRLRLGRIDTPERGQPGFELAKAVVEDWLAAAAGMAMSTDWPLRVATAKTGKYGRWIAEVYDLSGTNLNRVLIQNGWGEKE